MTSHEFAGELKATAERLLAAPDVEIGNPSVREYFWTGDKERFLAVVRALKPGKKEMNQNYVTFKPTGTCLAFMVDRNVVCRKVQDVKYECEPLLSAEEDAEMEAAS